MALDEMPLVTILKATMGTLEWADLPAQLAELLESIPGGAPGQPMELKLRWARNRYTTLEEKPCVALAFVSDSPVDPQDSDRYPSAGEALRECALDIIVDIDLPTETAVEEEQLIADVAGLEILSHVERRVVQALKAGWIDQAGNPSPLSAKAHWVQEIGVDNDEDLIDFNGRLVSRVNVLYRVSSEDPTKLLFDGG